VADKQKIAVVTGGSSGIGKAVCGELARRGYYVYEFSRRENSSVGVHHIAPVSGQDPENLPH